MKSAEVCIPPGCRAACELVRDCCRNPQDLGVFIMTQMGFVKSGSHCAFRKHMGSDLTVYCRLPEGCRIERKASV
jgi:hypothetical protein